MTPVKFKQCNHTLAKPADMTNAQCRPLLVWTDGTCFLSCWKLSWRERLAALFFGRAWVWIYGKFYPPVCVEARRTPFFTKGRLYVDVPPGSARRNPPETR